ncbi:hypothetical protein ACIBRY_23025 [Streptomyces anulatus]
MDVLKSVKSENMTLLRTVATPVSRPVSSATRACSNSSRSRTPAAFTCPNCPGPSNCPGPPRTPPCPLHGPERALAALAAPLQGRGGRTPAVAPEPA